MRGREKQSHCKNGHPLAGKTPAERRCVPCRRMRARRHLINDTAIAEKRRAYRRAWDKRRRKDQPRRERPAPPPLPRRPKLTVCKRGHDRTKPENLTKRRECRACVAYARKMWLGGIPVSEGIE